MRAMKATVAAALLFVAAIRVEAATSEPGLTADQLVEMAMEANPQVRAARHRWESARHQIIQNYTPSDPQFSFTDLDSSRGFLEDSGTHNITITQSLQFPGKGLLQGRTAQRSADIARLTYAATVRDLRAQMQTAYYQTQLDLSLYDLISNNAENLR